MSEREVEQWSDSAPEYPVDGHDHTISCLELRETVDLSSNEEWISAANQIASGDGYHALLYSYDLDHPNRLITVVRWQESTLTKARVDIIDSAWSKMTFLALPPRSHDLVLGRSLSDDSTSSEKEIYIINGNGEFVKPELLDYADALVDAAVLDRPGSAPIELASATFGANPLQNDGTRTVTFVLHFRARSGDERLRFKDPKQSSYGGADCYESMIASPLKQWEEKGATVDVYAVKLRLWLSGS